MTHVDEKNYAIVEFDILSTALMKNMVEKDSEKEIIIISPWVTDYAIPLTWPSFTSNFVNIIDMQRTSDIIKLLLDRGIEITILTKHPDTLAAWMKKGQMDFCQKVLDSHGRVILTQGRTYNHGKLLLTSEHALSGSGNMTSTGRDPKKQSNLGELIHREKDERSYAKKVDWAERSIESPEDEPELE